MPILYTFSAYNLPHQSQHKWISHQLCLVILNSTPTFNWRLTILFFSEHFPSAIHLMHRCMYCLVQWVLLLDKGAYMTTTQFFKKGFLSFHKCSVNYNFASKGKFSVIKEFLLLPFVSWLIYNKSHWTWSFQALRWQLEFFNYGKYRHVGNAIWCEGLLIIKEYLLVSRGSHGSCTMRLQMNQINHGTEGGALSLQRIFSSPWCHHSHIWISIFTHTDVGSQGLQDRSPRTSWSVETTSSSSTTSYPLFPLNLAAIFILTGSRTSSFPRSTALLQTILVMLNIWGPVNLEWTFKSH